MKRFEKLFPALVVLVLGGWAVSAAAPRGPGKDGIDYDALGHLPVQDGGRVMPFDTFARTTLQALSGRTDVRDADGRVQASAAEWLAKVLAASPFEPGKVADLPVFRIDNDQLLAALELPRKVGFYRYSHTEVFRSYEKLDAEYKKVRAKRLASRPLDLFDTKVEDLAEKWHRYTQLQRNARPNVVPPQDDGGLWQSLADVDRQFDPTQEDLEEIRERAEAQLKKDVVKEFGNRLPPDWEEQIEPLKKRYQQRELIRMAPNVRGRVSPAAAAFTRILKAARDGMPKEFAAAMDEYRANHLAHVSADDMFKLGVEADLLDRAAPFYYARCLYIFVLILTAVGWLVWTAPLHRSALWLGTFAFALHTAALLVRMYIHNRPPVANLYSSAVFIGWGAVILCILLERMYRNGIGTFVAGVTGAATLYIADFLSGSGDTMGMLVAVLDTNFWLAVHVTTVTLGYTATFVAGVIAVTYLLRGVFTTSLTAEAEKSMGQMIYGVVCFATLLSFFGTVAGGIWADYSWGRFWGWDPKENGAVMIVIWNCLVLHARWAGMVKNRGMAVLAVFGNVITAWSWFGTNQLSIGLHNYGFNKELAEGCRWFWLSQLAVICIGLIPRQYWRSPPPGARPAAEPVESAAHLPATTPEPVLAVNGLANGHAPQKTGRKKQKRR
jgi:ABC-type transport system involved in cytochrome c biogenesis permease subunit